MEWEGLAKRVRADSSLLGAVLLKSIQVLVERLFLRVLLLNQKLDVVTLLALRLDHLQQVRLNKQATFDTAAVKCKSLGFKFMFLYVVSNVCRQTAFKAQNKHIKIKTFTTSGKGARTTFFYGGSKLNKK